MERTRLPEANDGVLQARDSAACAAGLVSAERGEGAVRGEDPRDPLEASGDAVNEPLAVAMTDLAVTPFVDGPGVLPGGRRLADDVLALDDPEAVASEDRGPVGHQLRAGVVEHGPEHPILCGRGVGPQREVGEPDVPAGPQHPEQLAHQSALAGLGDADGAGRLQADDRVEGAGGELERARASPR